MTVLVPDLIGQSVDCYLTPFIAGEQAAEFMPFLADLLESVTSQITPMPVLNQIAGTRRPI